MQAPKILDNIVTLLTNKAERECVKCRYAEFYIPLDTQESRDVAWKWIEMELSYN